MANLLRPATRSRCLLPDASATTDLKTSSLNLKNFITHVFPKSIFESMANNEIPDPDLRAVLRHRAGQLHDKTALGLVKTCEEIVHVMLQVTDYVMRFAPVGVFAAVASVITIHGLGVLLRSTAARPISIWRSPCCGCC